MDLLKTGKLKKIDAGNTKVAGKRLSNPGMMLRRRTGVLERIRGRARTARSTAGPQGGILKSIESALRISLSSMAIILACAADGGFRRDDRRKGLYTVQTADCTH